MINTTIIGLGKIGYLYDEGKTFKKISHFSAVKNNKNFKIVSVVEKNKKIINLFKKKNSVPVYNKIMKAFYNHSTEFLIIACELNFKIIEKIIKNTNLKYILLEKPFKISIKNLSILQKLSKKKKIFFSINFQRNFSSNYLNLFEKIKKGLIGSNLKCYCYFNKNFESNASHLLNLILLLNKNYISSKKINKDCINIKFNNLDSYFFKVSERYNNNSITIFGSKGKIEISSRPEFANLYLSKKDKEYKKTNILKLHKTSQLYERFPQDNVLKDVVRTIYYKKKPLLKINHMTKYLKIMDKVKKYL